MKRKITFDGNPLTLLGRMSSLNELGNDFTALNKDLQPKTLKDFDNKIKLITTFPSLDTPVCDFQVREFNKRASEISDEIVIIGISNDLPFAQKRFCAANGIERMELLSDYNSHIFGVNYGLWIKELNLLGRSVIILDKTNVIRYFEIVDEVTEHPDYDAAIEKLNEVSENPESSTEDKIILQCSEDNSTFLNKEIMEVFAEQNEGWEIKDEVKLAKKFVFDSPEAGYKFSEMINIISTSEKSYPRVIICGNLIKVVLYTCPKNGITENDLIMAKIIDQLGLDYAEDSNSN